MDIFVIGMIWLYFVIGGMCHLLDLALFCWGYTFSYVSACYTLRLDLSWASLFVLSCVSILEGCTSMVD